MGEKAVNASDSYVVEMLDAVAHEFGGDDGFFGYGNVAGSGGDDRDDAFAVALAITLERDGSGQRAVFGFGDLGGDGFVLLFGGASGEDVSSMLGKTGEDGGNLSGRFPFAENHFGHAYAERAVVIDLGESQIFERQMAETLHRLVWRELFGADLLEEAAQGSGVHG